MFLISLTIFALASFPGRGRPHRLVLLLVLFANETSATQPIMPLWLFASRDRSGAYALRLLYLGAMIGSFYFSTQFFQDVLGWSPLQAGLGFLPMTVVNFAVATQMSWLMGRFGKPGPARRRRRRYPGRDGVVEPAHPDTGYLFGVALPMVLIGIGQGLTLAPLTSFGIAGVKLEDAGAASGLLNTAHQLGTASGLSILVAVAARIPGDTPAARAEQVSHALTGSAVLLGLATVIVIGLLVAQRRSVRDTAGTVVAR